MCKPHAQTISMHAGHENEYPDLIANTFCDHCSQKRSYADVLPLSYLTDLNEIDLIFCYPCIQSENSRYTGAGVLNRRI